MLRPSDRERDLNEGWPYEFASNEHPAGSGALGGARHAGLGGRPSRRRSAVRKRQGPAMAASRPSTPGRTPCQRPRASFCAASRRRRSWLSPARAAAFASSIPRPTASTAIRRSRFRRPLSSEGRSAGRWMAAHGLGAWHRRHRRCLRALLGSTVSGTSPISSLARPRLCGGRFRLSGAGHTRRPSLSDNATGILLRSRQRARRRGRRFRPV